MEPHVVFPELTQGIWVRRPNRFVVEASLPDGRRVSVHTNNTGTMMSCNRAGARIWFSTSTNPNRKLPYTLHVVETDGGLVGVDTSVPGKAIAGALAAGELPGFEGYRLVRREVPLGAGTRLDLQLESRLGETLLMEVKNVTLAQDGVALFPDAVTARGTRHVTELTHLASQGTSTAIALVVQRGDVDRVSPADSIDPQFGRALRDAARAGVTVVAFQCEVSLRCVRIQTQLPVVLGD